MTEQADNLEQGKPAQLESARQARSGLARWFRGGFGLRCCRTSSPGSVASASATTTPPGSRPVWQRTDLISSEREAKLRAVLAKWDGDLGWDMFSLQRRDVEWLLINQDELEKTYLKAWLPGRAGGAFLDSPPSLPLSSASLRKADLSGLPLEQCDLSFVQLDGADLSNTNLKDANLEYAQLTGADLEGADLRGTHLAHADLREAWLDHKTVLTGAHLFTVHEGRQPREYVRGVRLARVRWHDSDISSIGDLDQFRRLGDDLIPWPLRVGAKLLGLGAKLRGKDSQFANRIYRSQARIGKARYQKYLSDAIAAYRQFARVLREFGLPHLAVRAEYRARQLERQVRRPLKSRSVRAVRRRYRTAQKATELWDKIRQGQPVSHKFLKRLWFIFVFSMDPPRDALRRGLNSAWHYCARTASFLLDLICGYGYKAFRVLIVYIVAILVFAGIYATHPPQQNPPHGWNTIWFSMIAFHGRGIINGDINPNSGMLWVPALEAAIGLTIEALLVAVIIRRLFRSD